MRFVLFYSGVESFNYFTDRIVEELNSRGHDTFVLDLQHMAEPGEHSLAEFMKYMEHRADVAVAFDGLGIKEDMFIELWDSMNTQAVNILMDHPLRFHPTMQKHPKNYVQLCCDRNHVKYVQEYFGDVVENVDFMPHAGTYMGQLDLAEYEKRPYDVLFSGTFYEPESYLQQIDRDFAGNETLRMFYYELSKYMIANTNITTEQSVRDVAKQMGISLPPQQLATLIAGAEPIDWMARMYWRKQVVETIAEAGIDIWLLGRGWENHPSAGQSNVHIVNDRVPFADTLPIMAKAKINLNVMPWFKDGTHDRIFNVLLQGSLPLTDSSEWLLEHFVDGRELAYYDLKNIERIPEIIRQYLQKPELAKQVISSGFDVVSKNFVWKNIVDQILGY